ncbi:hypothetical protein BDZ45DRAFT_755092 [Acephala macrosclerotiorum]|nr:hypothetical protein BDZ45DRAFT_755092 [Acephala macrosclerotiorum]
MENQLWKPKMDPGIEIYIYKKQKDKRKAECRAADAKEESKSGIKKSYFESESFNNDEEYQPNYTSPEISQAVYAMSPPTQREVVLETKRYMILLHIDPDTVFHIKLFQSPQTKNHQNTATRDGGTIVQYALENRHHWQPKYQPDFLPLETVTVLPGITPETSIMYEFMSQFLIHMVTEGKAIGNRSWSTDIFGEVLAKHPEALKLTTEGGSSSRVSIADQMLTPGVRAWHAHKTGYGGEAKRSDVKDDERDETLDPLGNWNWNPYRLYTLALALRFDEIQDQIMARLIEAFQELEKAEKIKSRRHWFKAQKQYKKFNKHWNGCGSDLDGDRLDAIGLWSRMNSHNPDIDDEDPQESYRK